MCYQVREAQQENEQLRAVVGTLQVRLSAVAHIARLLCRLACQPLLAQPLHVCFAPSAVDGQPVCAAALGLLLFGVHCFLMTRFWGARACSARSLLDAPLHLKKDGHLCAQVRPGAGGDMADLGALLTEIHKCAHTSLPRTWPQLPARRNRTLCMP